MRKPFILEIRTPHAAYEALESAATKEQASGLARYIIASGDLKNTLKVLHLYNKVYKKGDIELSRRQLCIAATIVRKKGNSYHLMDCLVSLSDPELRNFPDLMNMRLHLVHTLVKKPHTEWLVVQGESEFMVRVFWNRVDWRGEVEVLFAAVLKLQDAEASRSLLDFSDKHRAEPFLLETERKQLLAIIEASKADE